MVARMRLAAALGAPSPAVAAGNYQLAGGHRAAQYRVMKLTYHNSFWYISCMAAFKTSYGLIQQALYYSTIYPNPEVDCPSTNLQRANDLSPYYVF